MKPRSESNVGVMSPKGPGGARGLELLCSKSEDRGGTGRPGDHGHAGRWLTRRMRRSQGTGENKRVNAGQDQRKREDRRQNQGIL